MRIATTASPVSGSDVRHKMLELAEHTAKQFTVNVLTSNFLRKRMKNQAAALDELAALKASTGTVSSWGSQIRDAQPARQGGRTANEIPETKEEVAVKTPPSSASKSWLNPSTWMSSSKDDEALSA